MTSSTNAQGTTTYSYNALGERVKKSGPGGTTIFAYDEEGHLIGEYTGAGVMIQEIVWFEGLPVASLRPAVSGGGIEIFNISADHLGTPRVIRRATDGVIVWRWDSDPFGVASPNENPSGAGEFKFNLRFPGQYADAETGLNYNYFRDYNPKTGRYAQSDPIGLDGGVNTYSYVNNNPIDDIDPTGEFAWGLVFAGTDLAWQLYQNNGNFNCVNWSAVGMSALGGGLLNALGKGAFRFKRGAEWANKNGKVINPHSWDATKKWMNKERIQLIGPNQERHHWLFERNQGIGKNRPDWLKNQPWNTNPIDKRFNNWLGHRPELAWLGAPSWVPEILGGVAATIGGDCGC